MTGVCVFGIAGGFATGSAPVELHVASQEGVCPLWGHAESEKGPTKRGRRSTGTAPALSACEGHGGTADIAEFDTRFPQLPCPLMNERHIGSGVLSCVTPELLLDTILFTQYSVSLHDGFPLSVTNSSGVTISGTDSPILPLMTRMCCRLFAFARCSQFHVIRKSTSWYDAYAR